ncbi:hypothetical protein MAR_027560 [Mya arenaria]|uniref:Uncharacterized protein n=1 Tax=Mya arenaria TaxID=6604 RepID=A0ABY7EU50_MYAAR|nr:hypothetical protein MAR_027560 [Mya arenaria]
MTPLELTCLDVASEVVNGGENEVRQKLKYVDKTVKTSKKEAASQGEITFETPSLLTLFTTWSGKGDVNARTHNFTLRNWARLKPEVNPVLFIDDGYDATVAQRLGWKTHRIPKSSINGLPVLKDMFKVIKDTYKSTFYGYANSDILFTSNLVETLVHVYYDSFYSDNTTLVTGMRTNIVNLTEEEFSTQTTLLNAVSTRGQLYMTSAEDYFIYAAEYSWSDMPEFVVGLIAYDNWLVLNSRYREDHVIDASRTVTAAHHTVREPDYQSHFRENAQYNKVLFRKMMQFHVEPPYEKGFTNCIDKYTEFVDKKIEIRSRKLEDPCLF